MKNYRQGSPSLLPHVLLFFAGEGSSFKSSDCLYLHIENMGNDLQQGLWGEIN